MAGLETLDEFSPRDTDPVSLGDDSIRETRAKTKTSVGIEHYLDGPHKIPTGAQSVRPAAGRVGRMFWNTDTHRLEFDNGSAWVSVVDQKAQATILWHNAQTRIDPTATPIEVPFDYVIDDPGGFASVQYHQIIMPVNSICHVNTYLEFEGPTGGGYGVIVEIQQYDTASSLWQTLMKVHQIPIYGAFYPILNAMADSRWGQSLRVVVTNATQGFIYIKATTMGASPRFAMTVMGRTS